MSHYKSGRARRAGYFIYLNWLPTYFNRVLGVNLRSSAALSFLPWLVMAVGCSLAGVVADKMVASGDAQPFSLLFGARDWLFPSHRTNGEEPQGGQRGGLAFIPHI